MPKRFRQGYFRELNQVYVGQKRRKAYVPTPAYAIYPYLKGSRLPITNWALKLHIIANLKTNMNTKNYIQAK